MFEAGLFNLLQTVVTPTYAVFVPEGATFPCLSYQVVGAKPVPSLQNTVVTQKRVQIDSWAVSYDTAKTNAAAVEATLEGFQGTLSDGTVIQGCFKTQEIDLFEDAGRLFRTMSEFIFTY